MYIVHRGGRSGIIPHARALVGSIAHAGLAAKQNGNLFLILFRDPILAARNGVRRLGIPPKRRLIAERQYDLRDVWYTLHTSE